MKLTRRDFIKANAIAATATAADGSTASSVATNVQRVISPFIYARNAASG